MTATMPRPAAPTRRPAPLVSADALAQALEGERDLLRELLSVLARQRDAVATDDLAVIDDTVFATHRLLGTWREAQQRRRQMLTLLCGPRDVPLGSLDDELGSAMSDRLVRARADVRAAADSLRRELTANRILLQRAAAAGDSVLRSVARAANTAAVSPYSAASPAAYTGSAIAQADGGTFLDLRA